MAYTSGCFSFILENKKEDSQETIAVAAQRLLKSKDIILVTRNKSRRYIRPAELRDSDIIHDLEQKERNEPQNDIAANALDKPSNDDDANNQIINPEQESSPQLSKKESELRKWQEIIKTKGKCI